MFHAFICNQLFVINVMVDLVSVQLTLKFVVLCETKLVSHHHLLSVGFFPLFPYAEEPEKPLSQK